MHILTAIQTVSAEPGPPNTSRGVQGERPTALPAVNDFT
jgi:hypothetical protein